MLLPLLFRLLGPKPSDFWRGVRRVLVVFVPPFAVRLRLRPLQRLVSGLTARFIWRRVGVVYVVLPARVHYAYRFAPVRTNDRHKP